MRGKLAQSALDQLAVLQIIPSMRPALYARETDPGMGALARSTAASAFNEARALCAGNFADGGAWRIVDATRYLQ